MINKDDTYLNDRLIGESGKTEVVVFISTAMHLLCYKSKLSVMYMSQIHTQAASIQIPLSPFKSKLQPRYVEIVYVDIVKQIKTVHLPVYDRYVPQNYTELAYYTVVSVSCGVITWRVGLVTSYLSGLAINYTGGVLMCKYTFACVISFVYIILLLLKRRCFG